MGIFYVKYVKRSDVNRLKKNQDDKCLEGIDWVISYWSALYLKTDFVDVPSCVPQ